MASVGVIMGRSLPFTNSNSSIKTFRHALSLDEVKSQSLFIKSSLIIVKQHRAKFQPNYYHRPAPNEQAAKLDPEYGTYNASSEVDSSAASSSSNEDSPRTEKKKKQWGFFGLGETLKVKKTGKSIAPMLIEVGQPDDVLEVWFSGCHSGEF